MAINLASKYNDKVVERYTTKSVTNAGVNQDYDWEGVNSIKVWSIATVALNDYTRSGTARYGTASELADTIQTMTLTKDRAWTLSIDRGNNTEQMMVKKAGEILRRQLDEKVFPEIDVYRLGKMSDGAISNDSYAIASTTTSNAFEKFLDGQAKLDEAKVPATGRVCFGIPAYYNKIKRDTSFTLQSESNSKKLVNGQVGDIDSVPFIKVPSSLMPTNTEFMIVDPKVTVGPIKLKEYHRHVNPVGVSGDVLEGRVIYDAFVLDTKIDGLYAHYSSSPTA